MADLLQQENSANSDYSKFKCSIIDLIAAWNVKYGFNMDMGRSWEKKTTGKIYKNYY